MTLYYHETGNPNIPYQLTMCSTGRSHQKIIFKGSEIEIKPFSSNEYRVIIYHFGKVGSFRIRQCDLARTLFFAGG